MHLEALVLAFKTITTTPRMGYEVDTNLNSKDKLINDFLRGPHLLPHLVLSFNSFIPIQLKFALD